MTLIRDVRIFDGAGVLERGSVLLRGEKIEWVGTGIPPVDAEVVDGTGRTLLPGLIDSHTHSFPGSPVQALAFGVTTELDMFSSPVIAARLRAQAAGNAGLADVLSAGTGATAPGGYPWLLVERGIYPPFPTLEDPRQTRGFVHDRLAEGSDYLKIIIEDGLQYGREVPCLSPETVRALTRAANETGVLAVAHVSTLAAAATALDAGVDVLAHVFADRVADDAFAEAVVATSAAVIPTLTMHEGCDGGNLAADPRVGPYLHPAGRAGLTTGQARRELALALASVRRLHEHGVPLLAGTDTPNPGAAPGAGLHRELELLVAAGLTPAQALTAATHRPAEVFRLAGRGRVIAGHQADLLLVDGDPTTDITATRSIVAVWRKGVRFDRAAYRSGLRAVTTRTGG